MMLGTQFSNSMDMIGKAGSLRFERTDTQIQWSAVEASLVVVATAVATAAEVAMVAAADSVVAEASEVVMVEAVAMVEVHTLVEAALGLGLAVMAWKPRTLRILSPTLQHLAARRTQSSMSEM